MQLILLMLMMGLLLFIGVFAGINVLLGRSNKVKDLFREPEAQKKKQDSIARKFLKRVEGVFKPLGKILPRSPEEMSRQEQKLWQAGIRRKDGPVMLYGAKLGLILGILLVSSVTGHLQEEFFPMIVVAFFAGSFLPDLWLSRKVKKRKETIGLSLADAVDLTVVCVEAGLGLDQSLMRIGEEMKHSHPDLSEELGPLPSGGQDGSESCGCPPQSGEAHRRRRPEFSGDGSYPVGSFRDQHRPFTAHFCRYFSNQAAPASRGARRQNDHQDDSRR